MAHCSYDVHVQEIIGVLILGTTVVLLRPQSNMDLKYVVEVLYEKQITYLQSVPTYVNYLVDFLLTYHLKGTLKLRTLDIGGKNIVILAKL